MTTFTQDELLDIPDDHVTTLAERTTWMKRMHEMLHYMNDRRM